MFAKMARLHLGVNPYNVNTSFELDFPVTSYFISSKTLAILRGLMLLYSLLVFGSSLALNRPNWALFLGSFTTLSYMGSILYYSLSLYYSVRYNLSEESYICYSLISRRVHFRYFIWLIYDTVVVYQFLLPPVYWCVWINHRTSFQSNLDLWIELSFNGVNLFFVCVELFMARWQLMLIHLPVVLLVVPLYFIFCWIITLVSGNPVYLIAELKQKPDAIIVSFFITLATVALTFAIVYSLHKLRDLLGDTIVRHQVIRRRSDLELIENGSRHKNVVDTATTTQASSGLQCFLFL
ncbi:hypothetical protein K7432_012347 [Basidiobolus ranarum]|uniref:Uncharacterized protein n=1 Tax=Basidiobolus ranarum TaxID=34480 RepID=A0ABR2VSD7_9FUNG